MDVQNVGFHKKCHISVNMRPTDLRQVSKFSLVQYLKLFLWHPKDLVSRKRKPKCFWHWTFFLAHPLLISFIQVICIYNTKRVLYVCSSDTSTWNDWREWVHKGTNFLCHEGEVLGWLGHFPRESIYLVQCASR